MSISAGENIKSYTASAGQVLFNFPYPYFDNTDMTVTQESGGTVTSLVYNVDYTVAATGGNPENGCDITLTTGATLDDTVTIERVVPLSQEYDLQEGSPIDPTALNKALDRTVAQSQQIDAEVGRNITHPVTDAAGLTYEAPSVTDRASKALGWDASGNVTALDLSTTGTVGVDTNAGLSMTTNVISAKVDDTTTTFVAGDIAVKDGGVDTAQLAADAVDGTKIADDAIDSEHIAAGAVDFDHLADTETTLTDTDVKIPTSGAVKDYVDGAPNFSPSSYTGGESVTLPNGLIMKTGFSTGISGDTSEQEHTITFGTAFPSGVVSAQLTLKTNTINNDTCLYVRTLTTTILKVAADETNGVTQNIAGYYWTVIGY